jgi:hypothetical protein
MYIDFTCIVNSPLTIPYLKEIHCRLIPIIGNSLVLVNLTLLNIQGVMFSSTFSLENQIRTMIDTLPPDMLFMYVGGQEDLLPQAKVKIREDMWDFINGTTVFFRAQHSILNLMAAALERNYYVRVNHVMDDALQPYLIVTVTPRV